MVVDYKNLLIILFIYLVVDCTHHWDFFHQKQCSSIQNDYRYLSPLANQVLCLKFLQYVVNFAGITAQLPSSFFQLLVQIVSFASRELFNKRVSFIGTYPTSGLFTSAFELKKSLSRLFFKLMLPQISAVLK